MFNLPKDKDAVIVCTELSLWPKQNFTYDAGVDIFSPKDLVIESCDQVKIRTDMQLHWHRSKKCHSRAHIKIEDKSSFADKKIRIEGGGVVDYGYEGEIFVTLHNYSKSPINIKKGSSIGQMIPINWDPTFYNFDQKMEIGKIINSEKDKLRKNKAHGLIQKPITSFYPKMDTAAPPPKAQ